MTVSLTKCMLTLWFMLLMSAVSVVHLICSYQCLFVCRSFSIMRIHGADISSHSSEGTGSDNEEHIPECKCHACRTKHEAALVKAKAKAKSDPATASSDRGVKRKQSEEAEEQAERSKSCKDDKGDSVSSK